MLTAETRAEIEAIKARGERLRRDIEAHEKKYSEDEAYRKQHDRERTKAAAIRKKNPGKGLMGSRFAPGNSSTPAPVAKPVLKSTPSVVITLSKPFLPAKVSINAPIQSSPTQTDGSRSSPEPVKKVTHLGILGSRWNPANQMDGSHSPPEPVKKVTRLGILGSKWNPANMASVSSSQPCTIVQPAPVVKRSGSLPLHGNASVFKAPTAVVPGLQKQAPAAKQNIPQVPATTLDTSVAKLVTSQAHPTTSECSIAKPSVWIPPHLRIHPKQAATTAATAVQNNPQVPATTLDTSISKLVTSQTPTISEFNIAQSSIWIPPHLRSQPKQAPAAAVQNISQVPATTLDTSVAKLATSQAHTTASDRSIAKPSVWIPPHLRIQPKQTATVFAKTSAPKQTVAEPAHNPLTPVFANVASAVNGVSAPIQTLGNSIHRPPPGINPSKNSSRSHSAVDHSAFEANVNTRDGNASGKRYTGVMAKRQGPKGTISERRDGTKVWVDNIVMGNLETSSTPFPKNGNANPPRKTKLSCNQTDIRPKPAGKISDGGIPKEHVRATQGTDPANELLGFDGRWIQPPWNWETRGGFDNSYISSYIKEWTESIPISSKKVDTSVPEFVMGTHLVGEETFSKPPVYVKTFSAEEPTAEEAEKEEKRVSQTAVVESELFTTALKTLRADKRQMAHVNSKRRNELAELEPEPNLFAPKIEMYLRPATSKDASGIAKLYNHYVNNSIIPEDQDDVSETDIGFLLKGCEVNKLPFIVAVKGSCPPTTDAQGRKLNKVVTPQFENIIGFAFTQVQAFGFGLSNSFNGRSRTNANLHLYVQPDLQRQGVGRNLLDRLLLSMNPAYSFHDAASWINPEQDTRFDLSGIDRWNQLFFQLPVDRTDDPEFLRIREFLAKFFFFDSPESRSIGAGRTSRKHGPARFVDIVTFKGTCLHAAIFGPFT